MVQTKDKREEDPEVNRLDRGLSHLNVKSAVYRSLFSRNGKHRQRDRAKSAVNKN